MRENTVILVQYSESNLGPLAQKADDDNSMLALIHDNEGNGSEEPFPEEHANVAWGLDKDNCATLRSDTASKCATKPELQLGAIHGTQPVGRAQPRIKVNELYCTPIVRMAYRHGQIRPLIAVALI